MKITREQRNKIIRLFLKQRGNVKVDNARFLDALIYVCATDRKWRSLPETFRSLAYRLCPDQPLGQNGVLERIFHVLQEEQVTDKRITVGFPGFQFGQGAS